MSIATRRLWPETHHSTASIFIKVGRSTVDGHGWLVLGQGDFEAAEEVDLQENCCQDRCSYQQEQEITEIRTH